MFNKKGRQNSTAMLPSETLTLTVVKEGSLLATIPVHVPKKREVVGGGQLPFVCKPLKLRDVTTAEVDSLY